MSGMPIELRRQIEAMAGPIRRETAAALSEAYRTAAGEGKRLATTREEAWAYACARMPATFAAAERALALTLDSVSCRPQTLLDVGAGTGAVTLAAQAALPLESALCLEREAEMRAAGQSITALAQIETRWEDFDIQSGALPRAQLVCEGYMLGELREDDRLKAAQALWEAAEQLLLLVEPGTPQGFANLQAVRNLLTRRGAFVAAPCPGNDACPLQGEDWCHFAVRVERTQLMKRLKGGETPYEDEKFAFLALSREKPRCCEARILRHPQIGKGRIELTLCRKEGIKATAITKKDPLWKRARKAEWGEGL